LLFKAEPIQSIDNFVGHWPDFTHSPRSHRSAIISSVIRLNRKTTSSILIKYEKLIKLVREYVFSKIKKNDDISNNNIVEAYFEWESEKNETKLS